MSLKLGDKVAKLIELVVPKKIVKAIQEKEGGCGCAEKQRRLNELI